MEEVDAMENMTAEQLAQQKLRLEIKDLMRPWYARPVYLSVILPTALGAVTIAVALFTNAIGDRLADYKDKTQELTHVADSLHSVIDSAMADIAISRADINSLTKATMVMDSALTARTGYARKLEEERGELQRELKHRIARASSDVERVALLDSVARHQSAELTDLRQLIERLQKDLASAKKEVSELRPAESVHDKLDRMYPLGVHYRNGKYYERRFAGKDRDIMYVEIDPSEYR